MNNSTKFQNKGNQINMITCKEASQLLSRECEKPLPLIKKLLLTNHVAFCEACQLFKMQLKGLRSAFYQFSQSDHSHSPYASEVLSEIFQQNLKLKIQNKLEE